MREEEEFIGYEPVEEDGWIGGFRDQRVGCWEWEEVRLTAAIEVTGDRTARMSSGEDGARSCEGGDVAEMICVSP